MINKVVIEQLIAGDDVHHQKNRNIKIHKKKMLHALKKILRKPTTR